MKRLIVDCLIWTVIVVAIGGVIGLLVYRIAITKRRANTADRNTCQTLARLSHASSYEFHTAYDNYCEIVVSGKIYTVEQ